MWKKRRFKKEPLGVFKKILPIIAIFLIVILLFFFIKKGFLTIKKIETTAIQLGCINESQLKISSGVSGRNLFLINSIEIEKTLKQKFFCIKSVNISKQFPDKVIIQVSGRQPFAGLIDLKDKPASPSSLIENIATPSAEVLGDSYLVDEEGVIFDKNKDVLTTPKIYVYNLNVFLGSDWVNDLPANPLRILNRAKTFGIDIGESLMDDGFFIINSKPKIIFNLNGDINIQLASLQLILAEAKINLKELEFIDLRFDKPIVRFTPEKNGKR